MLWCTLWLLCKNDVRFVFTLICFVRISCELMLFVFISRILVSNTISIWDDVQLTETLRMSLVNRNCYSIPEHMSSLSVVRAVCVSQSLVSCILFCTLLLFFYSLPFFSLRLLINYIVPLSFSLKYFIDDPLIWVLSIDDSSCLNIFDPSYVLADLLHCLVM